MRALVLANPWATATSRRERAVLEHAVGSLAHLQVAETEHRGHAAALACRAMRDGVDLVIVIGGDGTVNEAVNGLLTDGVHPGVPALGIVPTGSTNVVARALGIPNSPLAATGQLIDAVQHNRRRRIGVGLADDRYFVFAVGVGFDAELIRRVEQQRERGKRATNLLYLRQGLRQYLATDRRHPKLTVETSEGETIERLYYLIVTNTDPWTFVGSRPIRPTPQAAFEAGLDLYGRRRMSGPGLLFSMARMAAATPRIGRRGATLRHDLEQFSVRAEEPILVQVDGDLIGPRDKLDFRSVPDALDVLT